MSKQRNNIIELGRFVYSLLVVGYHIQLSYDEKDETVDPFECGALAVEYYFFLSGYFLARSLEKISQDNKTSFIMKYYTFMKNKIKALLNVHFIAIVAVLIIIASCDKDNFVKKLLPGITSIFLVQMIVVYHGNFTKALIVPEWYLSSMIICMLIMVPIFLAFRKLMRGVFVVLILLGVLAIFALVFVLVTKFDLKPNMIFDMRAWGEMNLSMFSYYLSIYISKKTYGNGINILLKIIEIVAYCLPVILGIIPISSNNEPICMSITGACAFVAIFITFANKGNIIKSEKVNFVFGYLGSISLPIYIFHPVIIILIDYIWENCPKYAKYLIVFISALGLAFVYRIVADFLNKKIEERKKKKEIEQNNEKDNDMIKKKENEEINENINVNENKDDSDSKNNQILDKEN